MINIHNKKEVKRYENELTECRVYCKCGCSIVFQVQTDKLICRWCGRTVYNNSLAKFRKVMREELNDNNCTNN